MSADILFFQTDGNVAEDSDKRLDIGTTGMCGIAHREVRNSDRFVFC